MARKQSKNYIIKYNFFKGKADIKKIMEDNFLKYFQNMNRNNQTINKQ